MSNPKEPSIPARLDDESLDKVSGGLQSMQQGILTVSGGNATGSSASGANATSAQASTGINNKNGGAI